MGRRRASHGPFTLADFVGLDTLGSICDVLFDEFRERRFARPPTLRQLLAAGWYGRKSGRGFYDSGDEPVAVGCADGTPAEELSGSETRALVLLVALNDVAAARGRRPVLLALEVAIDLIGGDVHASGVLEDLDAAAHRVPGGA
jgi:3-hydroxyacyl-CoA dehydrogenase